MTNHQPSLNPLPHHFYLALRPDMETRTRIDSVAKKFHAAGSVRGRWLRRDGYHLTLMSLGHSFDPCPPTVQRAMEAARRVNASEFPLSLTHAGTFGREAGPFYGWLGCNDIDASLFDLRVLLRDQLRQAGIRPDCPSSFTPHVTVVREADRPLPERAFVPIPWLVDRFVLVRTTFSPTFGQEDLASIPLWN